MKKTNLTTVIIFFLLIANIFFIGCLDSESYKEKIIGKWISEQSIGENESAIFQFFNNDTYSLSLSLQLSSNNYSNITLWWTYSINEEVLELSLNGTKEYLDYTFYENDTKLLLIERDSTAETILYRIDN